MPYYGHPRYAGARKKIKQRSMKFRRLDTTEMLEKRVGPVSCPTISWSRGDRRRRFELSGAYFNEGDFPQFNWDRGGRLLLCWRGPLSASQEGRPAEDEINLKQRSSRSNKCELSDHC